MPSETTPARSFSAGRRWGIFLSVLVSIASVAALVVMLNYLGARHFERFDLSPVTRQQLTPQTLGMLRTLTNEILITVYYDKTEALYDLVLDLAKEYKFYNPHIKLRVVDSVVDAAEARKVQAEYKLGLADGKNLVIVANEHRHVVIKEAFLSSFSVALKEVQGSSGYEVDRQLKSFNGEMYISASILNVCNPNPASAYFLQGHGEHRPDSTERISGYEKFCDLLAQNNVRSDILNLAGTNEIPTNCNLLVIAGPMNPIPRDEVDKIRHYLARGGRLFALFNCLANKNDSGLESLLREWDILLSRDELEDKENASGPSDTEIFVGNFNTNHMVSSHLLGYRLRMARPRSVGFVPGKGNESQNSPKATWLATTGAKTVIVKSGSRTPAGGGVPVIVAAEKANVKGAFEGGTARIIVAGDSTFLANDPLDMEANRDFASLALNWLLEQTSLMAGVGPHKVTPIRLAMTNAQMRHVSWIFLAAMPGAVLLLGGLVWLRRRH